MLVIRTNDHKDIEVNAEYLLSTDIVNKYIMEERPFILDVSESIVDLAIEFGKFYIELSNKDKEKVSDSITYDTSRKVNQQLNSWFLSFKSNIKDTKTLVLLIHLTEQLNITPLNELCCYIFATHLHGKKITDFQDSL